jgi:hypothetical protein
MLVVIEHSENNVIIRHAGVSLFRMWTFCKFLRSIMIRNCSQIGDLELKNTLVTST